ncbi:hypothetical protein [Bradyrhizobium erythrophlei]|uniref:Amidoligase enzyme n=1 Tax=Bradyrhizobium erythrophlei TaxID=1437360 RepID=A0A1M5TAC9_9BRAD|nr:hypothetical protein [Bradyrhizobium erythrophlei]SHH47626.1 hypothetical protein SAMN05444169_7642 [Bradyrhizobium erythrophlei]
MFFLPKSFTNPDLQSLTLEQYFNPTINKFFVTGRKNLTGPELLHFYKSLYTGDNIVSNIPFFFPPEYGVPEEDVRYFISKIDEADLWQLAFLAISHPSSGNRLTWIKNPIYMIDYSQSARRVDCHFNRSQWNMQYSFRGDNFKEEMTTVLRELGNNFNNLLVQYPDYQINMDTYFHGNAVLVYMAKFAKNSTCYKPSAYTPETLALEMTNNPTMTLRVTRSDWQACTIAISNPVTKTNKAALWTTLSYSADVLELLPWPLIVKGEQKPICYGVELEVSTQYTTKQLVEASDEPFFAGKQDSSISGTMRNKVELVTAPMSLKSHKKEWSHLFSNLDYDLFDTTVDTNNGMHVHIGREHFNDNHLRTFAWFFGNPCNLEFIVALSERKANQMHQYAAMPSWPEQATKTSSLKSVVEYFDMLRGAVNLHKSKPTVEVRIFKGIASYATILKNLEVVDAIFHFTQQSSQTASGLREFLNFLRKTPRNKYPVLKEFIATLDTKKMLSAAQLNDLVFNVKDPRQILSIIEKKHFPITSHHVSILNAKQGVRTFIFNKDTGTIEIVRTKHGRMSHLDRVLEKKYTRSIQPRAPVTDTPEPAPNWYEPTAQAAAPRSVGLSTASLRRAQAALRSANVAPPYHIMDDMVSRSAEYQADLGAILDQALQPPIQWSSISDSNDVNF